MSAQPLEVLIVEDEVLLATELEYLLQELGCHTVGMAMNSEEAVAMAEALNPDLALVDVHLEDGPTGVDAARRIKADCGGVVLFMTANVKRLPEDFAGACRQPGARAQVCGGWRRGRRGGQFFGRHGDGFRCHRRRCEDGGRRGRHHTGARARQRNRHGQRQGHRRRLRHWPWRQQCHESHFRVLLELPRRQQKEVQAQRVHGQDQRDGRAFQAQAVPYAHAHGDGR